MNAQVIAVVNRPLAKLSEAVKITDTGNQREAERKAFSAITVTLRENAKPFDEANGVFNKDTLPGNFTIFLALLFGQWMIL